MMNKNILIVDDEKGIRELLRLYLEMDGYTVMQAENGRDALEIIESSTPCLAVVDIMMPKMDGYELTRVLRERSDIPIIILSVKTESHEKILGLELGADDYMTKPFDPMELLARIKAQLRRYSSTAGEDTELSIGSMKLNTATCRLRCGETEIALTATEYNMINLFMGSPGRVFTKQQIYDAAWPGNSVVDDNTIMVAISKLRNKLPRDSAAIITTIRGLGYRLEVQK